MVPLVSRELREEVTRRVRASLGVGAYVAGAATGQPYLRFLGLRGAAERAFWRGDLDDAEVLARELLALAARYESDWNYGNGVHHAHTLLGRIELKRNHLGPAIEHLHESAKTRASPQLSSFGPSMILARELLELGETESVLHFFDLCREFWQAPGFLAIRGVHPLEAWRDEVLAGKTPDFGGNLVY